MKLTFYSVLLLLMSASANAQMQPDYFEVRDAQSLLAPGPDARELVILTAARLGRARLIDNLKVGG